MEQPQIIQLPKIQDPRGNLTFIQNGNTIPFDIKRVFWIYDVPGGEIRGGHALKTQHEIIISLSGSFDVVITLPNGQNQKFTLNRSYFGLYIPANHWRHMENFSTNAVSLHLCNDAFDENDYSRDLNAYLNQ
ncbi:sugar 3,4-ketoisomerase [Flavobacterium macrobrachii]|jgi:dTDP-4-dehydrorhamnose 3,5-epimerase-like enzyme|uniref:WxcM-like domain-containing protein n=1 Tax=Flavobacterium macrobrachii TaxID=591204 RepID=A0ABS2CXX8_9FLAO|nr:FdtA/QdtA family cupin domain-containing protein [Flavobacterium macrobrachii]MBM6499813.1 WxcM-like domain-containing protein [Flavobacterium macrobrachii]